MSNVLTLGISAFSAGLLSSMSPCVYPVIPLTIGYLGVQSGTNGQQRIWLFFVGQVLGFSALGLLAVKLGEIFGFTSESPILNFVVGIFLILFGIMSWSGWMPTFLLRLNDQTNQASGRFRQSGIGAALIGLGAAFLASPCTTPLLGSVLVMLSQSGSLVIGLALMVLYGAGASLVFLLVGLGLVKAKSLPMAGPWLKRIHELASLAMVVGGVYYLVRIWV